MWTGSKQPNVLQPGKKAAFSVCFPKKKRMGGSKSGLLVPLQPEPLCAFYSSRPNSNKPERKQESVCASSEGQAFLDQKQHQRDKALILLEFKEQLSFQKVHFSPAAAMECFKKEPLLGVAAGRTREAFPGSK